MGRRCVHEASSIDTVSNMKLKLQAADVTRGRSFSERNYSFEQDFTYYTPQPSKSSMNSLVAYDSSDEEDNDSELPKPAKVGSC